MSKRTAPGSRDRDLNAMVAENIFGWKNIRRVEGKLVGRKPDKLGRFRVASVPNYVGDARQAAAIETRMVELRKAKQYARQLEKLAAARNLPPDWATAELRAQAALEAVRLKTVK
jgi:hypothetical protein